MERSEKSNQIEEDIIDEMPSTVGIGGKLKEMFLRIGSQTI